MHGGYFLYGLSAVPHVPRGTAIVRWAMCMWCGVGARPCGLPASGARTVAARRPAADCVADFPSLPSAVGGQSACEPVEV